eukprot:scpid10478/ scgid24489/ Transcriptional enhancer factor TEF-3; M-CAT-binding factor; RTEF-1; TEA domain family member 4; TEF-1
MANTLSNRGSVPAFSEKFQKIGSWFSEFSQSEQLILLYTLFCKLSMAEARFSLNVLEKRIQGQQPPDPSFITLETEGNDPDYISSLQAVSRELAISALLTRLPVLRPGNIAAVDQYAVLLDSVMQSVVKTGLHRNNAMQLLSLVMVHPAVPQDQRDNLVHWREKIENSIPATNYNGMALAGPVPQPNAVPNHYMPVAQGHLHRTWHQNMDQYVAPPPAPPLPGSTRYSPSHQLLNVPHVDGRVPIRSSSMQVAGEIQHIDDSMERNMSRSQSLPMPVRPGPRSAGNDNQFPEPRPGMKEVPHWLKGLRLHKYQDLFAEMSYEEMLNLSDETLTRRGVTTGARHKILVSLQRLRTRRETLIHMARDVENPSRLINVITDLKQLINSPMKPYSPAHAVSSASSPESSLPPDAASCVSLPAQLQPPVGAPPLHGASNGLDSGGSRTSPVFDSSSSNASAQWPGVERQESDGSAAAACADVFEQGDNGSRAPAKNSISSVSSVGSSNSSSSQQGSDVAPSPSPADGMEQDELPVLTLEVVVKACQQLCDCAADEDMCTAFLSIVDRAMTHEAFTADHRRLLFTVRQKCNAATRIAQRKNLHDQRFMRTSNWLPNVPGVPGYHPGLPLAASAQPLPRNLPPPSTPTAAAAAVIASAAAIQNASHRRRGYERQNARNSTVPQPPPPHAGMQVPPPPPPVAMQQMPPSVGPPPAQLANPFGAPGSGRRSQGMPPVLMPDNDRAEVWATPSDYSNLLPPDADTQPHTVSGPNSGIAAAAAAAAAASAAPSNVSGGEIAAGPAGTGGTGSPSAGHDEQNGDGDSDPDGDGGVNRDDAEGIWSPDIEQSFQEALAIYPPCGRRKIILSDEGKMYGRNELIARYIKIRTGKIRTRKQVSSHIQVLARKRSRELQTKLKEAPTDKEQGKLHSIVHSLPGMSSAQIVSTQFHDDGDEMNNPSAANNAAGGAPGGPGGNHLAAAMKPESYQHGDGTLTSGPAPVAMPVGPNAHGHSQMMPRTVGAVSAAAATTGSSSLKAEQQQQHGGSVTTSGLGNAVLCAAPVPSNAAANPLWHSSAAVHSFHDPMRYGVPAAAGHPAMMAGVSPGFIMPMTAHGSTMPLVGQTSQVVHPGMNHISATPAVAAAAAASVTGGVTSMSAPVPMTNNSSSLVSLTAFKEDHPASDSSDGVVFSQHCFVHIPPTTNFHDPSLESIEIRQVCDKFPTLSDLYEKGPPDVFFLVKFWADIDMPEATGPENFYVSTVFRTADQVKCKCTTDVCSFGQPVVQKVEVLNSTFENGAHMVRSMRSKMCDYMVKFIRKLVALDSRAQMNEVLENFTIMQVVCNGDTGELLMCLAYAFEVSGSDTSGTYHNIYRLIKA